MKTITSVCLIIISIGLLQFCRTKQHEKLVPKSDPEEVRLKLIRTIHQLQYNDTVLSVIKDYKTKARFLYSLLDSADKYDPITDTAACIFTWYGEHNLFQSNKIDWRVAGFQPKAADNIREVSDRYKILWYINLALTQDKYDTLYIPCMVNRTYDDSIISFDKLVKKNDDNGKSYHCIKINTQHYLSIKRDYQNSIISSDSKQSNINSILNKSGYEWIKVKK